MVTIGASAITSHRCQHERLVVQYFNAFNGLCPEVYSVGALLHKVLVEKALNDHYCIDTSTIFIWEHTLSLIHERKYECTNLHHTISVSN